MYLCRINLGSSVLTKLTSYSMSSSLLSIKPRCSNPSGSKAFSSATAPTTVGTTALTPLANGLPLVQQDLTSKIMPTRNNVAPAPTTTPIAKPLGGDGIQA